MDLGSKAKEDRALAALRSAGEKGLTKNDLAQAVWGMVTSSTQSMTTRLTQSLLERGRVTEEADGRRRIVRLVRSELDIRVRRVSVPVERAYSVLHEASWDKESQVESVALATAKERPFDRPYAQLERAARWVAASLRRDREDDHRFAAVLVRTLTFDGNAVHDATEDRREIEGLIQGWDDPRKGLCRAIGIFGLTRERDFMARELLACVDDLKQGSEVLLWASMALAVARRLWLIGGERAENDHRRLVKLAKRALHTLGGAAPVHVAYWSALANNLRGEFDSASWKQPAARSEVAGAGAKLVGEIRRDEEHVLRDVEFNSFFAKVERLIAGPVVAEAERRVGFAKRFRHDQGATPMTAESWARDHARVLHEVFDWTRKKRGNEPLVQRLASQAETLKKGAPPATHVTRFPTIELVQFLASSEQTSGELRESMTKERAEQPLEYTELIRNNFWSPSMLWGDIALSTRDRP